MFSSGTADCFLFVTHAILYTIKDTLLSNRTAFSNLDVSFTTC